MHKPAAMEYVTETANFHQQSPERNMITTILYRYQHHSVNKHHFDAHCFVCEWLMKPRIKPILMNHYADAPCP